MINYETIKSVYDDKLTLMQWLNKVQEALKDATAVSFNVNKTGDATLTFSIVFDDGTELETEPIILEQGESVESATLRNGHLILTLTNGDELDAGDMGAVSSFSIDANQHLIVTYQDGTTNDLGAIFSGNVTISGNLSAGIITAGGGLRTNFVDPAGGSVVTIGDISVSTISSPNSNPIEVYPKIKSFEKIADTHGNLRFIEGNVGTEAITGVSYTYHKWSLSGSHLMVVVAGTIESGVTMSNATPIAYASLPSWVYDKVFPVGVGSVDNIVAYQDFILIGVDTYDRVTEQFYMNKFNSNLNILKSGNMTTNQKLYFRIEFDLLIDND